MTAIEEAVEAFADRGPDRRDARLVILAVEEPVYRVRERV